MDTPIKDAREKRGLTLVELSEMTDVSPSYLSEVERGLKLPNILIGQKIAKALRDKVARLWPPEDK